MPARMSGLSSRWPKSFAGPVMTARCGSQRMIRAPIETSLSTKNSRLSNIFSKTSTVPVACVAATTAIEVRSAGNAGQMPLSSFGICPPRSSTTASFWPGRTRSVDAPDLELDSELPERRDDRDQVVGLDVLDREIASRDRGEHGEARDLDVLGPDAIRAAAEPVDALDPENVRADSLDLGAEADEEAAEVLDMGLAGSVADDRLAFGEHRRHDRVLGAHHRRLVEVHPLADELLGAEVVGAVDLHRHAELGEGVDVGVEPAAPDHVASRGRHDGPAEAGEQRPGEQERRADLAAEIGVELGLRDAGAIDAHLVRPRPGGVGAEVDEQLDHHLDVADARQVREQHLLGGEHGRGEDRQSAVLVPGCTDRAGERATALDDERLHEAGAIVPVPWR